MVIGTGLDKSGNLGGITVFHISWAGALFSAFLFFLFNHGFKLDFTSPINKYVYLYIGFSLFSLIYSPNKESGLLYLATTTALFIAFHYFRNFISQPKHYISIIYTMLFMSVIISLVAFYQLLTFNPWDIATPVELQNSGEKLLRGSGTFDDPNVAATYLMVAILFSLTLVFLTKISVSHKVILIIGSLISSAGMIATFSRTGWISIAAGIFLLSFYIKDRRFVYRMYFGIFIFLIGFILFTKYGDFILERVVTIFDIMGDTSIRSRVFMAVSGLWMFMDNPILGIGYRGFPVLYDLYIHPNTPQIILYVKESHTLIITLLAEIGIIGFLIVLFWFKRVFSDVIASYRNEKDDFKKAILIGSFVTFTSLNINFFFYGSLFPHFDLIWLLFAFIYMRQDQIVEKS